LRDFQQSGNEISKIRIIFKMIAVKEGMGRIKGKNKRQESERK